VWTLFPPQLIKDFIALPKGSIKRILSYSENPALILSHYETESPLETSILISLLWKEGKKGQTGIRAV
jgi:hypothetical protein